MVMMGSDEGSSRSVCSPQVPPEDSHEHEDPQEEKDLDEVREDWTNHTIYMRRALTYCRKLLQTFTAQPIKQPVKPQQRSSSSTNAGNNPNRCKVVNINKAARNLPHDREQGLRDFWDSSPQSPQSPLPTIQTIQTIQDLSPAHFRRKFLHANVPCVMRGEVMEAHFECATSNWIHLETSTIDRAWFRTHVGADTPVPIRHAPLQQQQQEFPKDGDDNPPSLNTAQLDEDGRAVECETKHMPLDKWIDMLDRSSTGRDGDGDGDGDGDTSTSTSTSTCDPSHYLKDWHLIAWLAHHNAAADQLPLYHTPSIFPYDLLNGFLTRHTAGDYRFVYWGPANSTTELHSDVLNSYSWSYNICGCKEWTFYPPHLPCVTQGDGNDDGNDDDDDDPAAAATSTGIVVLQQAGECMFVPSGWKHRVVNMKETLSINHNWITTSNLRLTWDVLQTEMRAIEVELTAWGMADDCWDARENMLLGCCGLDITSFFWMILSRALELLQQDSIEDNDNGDDNDDWEIQQFDLICLGDMLSQLLDDKVLHVHDRLAATLSGDTPAKVAIEMAKTVLNMIDLSE